VKRGCDIVLALAIGALALPVLLAACVAILLETGRPVLFRQPRAGVGGVRFTLCKLRTMVKDAADRDAEHAAYFTAVVRGQAPRNDGLFKLVGDPRVTRVGGVLRRLSIDELPQLWNVLRGEMSLVGPRPALPHEVAEFDDELLGRHRVQPGITGLWQVEARDKPDFEIYRRLDLFYVDNWSMGLDLAIVFGTACSVLGRILPSRLRGRTPAPA
ncbi:MAG: sugar transferase, partial [Acidimicrobiia bacterium]